MKQHQPIIFLTTPKMMLTYLKLEVQGLRGDEISPHELERCRELLFKLFAAHDLGGLSYLSE